MYLKWSCLLLQSFPLIEKNGTKPEECHGQPAELDLLLPVCPRQSSSLTEPFSAEPKLGLRLYLKRTMKRQYDQPIELKEMKWLAFLEVTNASLITTTVPGTEKYWENVWWMNDSLRKVWIILWHKVIRPFKHWIRPRTYNEPYQPQQIHK